VFKNDLNNSEWIWTIQYANQIQGGSTPNLISWNYIPQYTVNTGDNYAVNMGGNGAGFVLMNTYFQSLFNNDPGDNRDSGTYYIMDYTYNNPAALPPGVKLGDTMRQWSENSDDPSVRSQYYARLNPGCLKFVTWTGDPSQAHQIKNLPVYRLAETYLIAGEANMHLGNTTLALQELNTVRARANAQPLTTINQQVILDERARELGFEGQRWYTLKRMGVLYNQITQHAGSENANGVLFQAKAKTRFQPYMVNWPIPLAEMNVLGPSYPQNEGY
ncbi:MAG: RagB/SusD family nutrient uptake outer membrane protein, partial [Chitinophagaceae bacterium]